MHAPTPTPVAQGVAAHSRRWRALAILSVAQFMLILDVTVVAVALPDIGADLDLGRASLTWVISAYTLLFGGLMLVGGRAADLFGSRRIAMTGLAVFTAASAVAGLAGTAEVLIAGRVGQGVGAALLSPASLSLVTTTFHGAERGRALAVWSSLGGVGAAIGVLLGGALTAGPGWQWVFYLNLPVGLVLLAALPYAVAPSGPRGRPRLDVAGALLVTTATTALIYGLINAGDAGWTAPGTWGPVAVAVALYAGFGVVEHAVRAPLMDLRILTRRPVLAGGLLIFVATGVLIAGFFLASFALQRLYGYGAMATGLLFLPIAAATIVGTRAAGYALPRVGPRPVAAFGLAVAATGTAAPVFWSGPAALVGGLTVAAVGLGATFVTAFTTATAQVDQHDAGITSGIVNTFHEFGG
ncbi:MAG: MFS transporter, partial [Pseudonocardia sp.]|nr:MFS transporter [Pseudonocardia sp.]